MRYEGVLKKWNEEKGFGFIRPNHGGHDVFVHISSFPKDGNPPRLNERISYELIQENGKTKAHFLNRLDITVTQTAQQTPEKVYRKTKKAKKESKTVSVFAPLIGLVLFVTVIYAAYQQFHRYQLENAESIRTEQLTDQPIKKSQIETTNAQYTCDGRTHCSQMHSCEEAKYFINHCPNTQMDGNHDGIPCEEQHCKNGW